MMPPQQSPSNAPSGTVPMFAPDGSLGDIPADRVSDALSRGFKQGINVMFQGQRGTIPIDRLPDAVKRGMIPENATPNAGLSDVAKPNVPMDTSTVGNVFGFVKGFGSTVGKATFGAGNLGEGGLGQPVSEQQLQAEQSGTAPSLGANLKAALSDASLSNLVGNTISGVSNTVTGLIKNTATPEGAGETTANLAMLMRGATGATKELLPSKARAGDLLDQAQQAASKLTVDVSVPGNTALKIQEMASQGGTMPKVIRDFLKRTTDPAQGPLTYEEARTFYSNASRLSANEYQRLTPASQRMVGQFARDLNSAITDTADAAGVGQQYRAGMSQYAGAAANAEKAQMIKDYIKAHAVEGALGAGGFVSLYKLLDQLNQRR